MSTQKARKAKFQLDDEDSPRYEMLGGFLRGVHDRLRNARIGVVWKLHVSPDTDGNLFLGKCHVLGEMVRRLTELDLIIEINQVWWLGISDEDRKFHVDCWLSRVVPVVLKNDPSCEQIYDDSDEELPQWRLRKPAVITSIGALERAGRDVTALSQLLLPLNRDPVEGEDEDEGEGEGEDGAHKLAEAV